MNDAALSPERILEAAEEALRRFGPGKATVVDVARALGVSHGSVYRHFPSKAALRDAVAERWLERLCAPRDPVMAGKGSAAARLKHWLETLMAAKHSRALADPELFATYVALAIEAREVVRAHVDTLISQLERIIAEGAAKGEFRAPDPRAAARAVFDATLRFHHPAHAADWSQPHIRESFEGVWKLILDGLRAEKPTAKKASKRA